GTTPFSLSIPSGLANGATITVRVRARDAAANLSDEASIVLTVGDTSPPSLTLLEPADGAAVAPGGTLTVRATATDHVAVRRFTLAVTGAFAFADARDTTPPSTPASAIFTVTVPQATAAGPVVVTVEAFDTDNRSSGAVSRTIGVSDVVAPTVQIATPVQDAA